MAFWKKFYKSRYTGAQIDAGIKGGAQVPDVTAADNGKVLKVSGGKWAKGTDSGTTVTANPTLAGTEAALEGLQVASTKYKVNQPINVVANPTLAGTEAALTGLQVGDTKYKIGGGENAVDIFNNSVVVTAEDYDGVVIVTTYDLSEYPPDQWVVTINDNPTIWSPGASGYSYYTYKSGDYEYILAASADGITFEPYYNGDIEPGTYTVSIKGTPLNNYAHPEIGIIHFIYNPQTSAYELVDGSFAMAYNYAAAAQPVLFVNGTTSKLGIATPISAQYATNVKFMSFSSDGTHIKANLWTLAADDSITFTEISVI